MRRIAYWAAVLVALTAMGVGGWSAYRAYRDSAGPEARVRAYFAALARADAPAALSYGDVPPGPHALLTSEVLAEQQRIAPLHDVRIVGVAKDGSAATVRYSYQLRFARGNQEVTGSLELSRRSDGWRLSATAVPVTFAADQALDRFTFADTSVPSGPTLVFPGAVPIRFDTPNLQLDPASAAVQFDGDGTVDLRVQPTAAARSTLVARLQQLVRRCLSPQPPAGCPTPSARIVPGTLSGSLVGDPGARLTVRVGSAASGTIDLRGTVVVNGRYQVLSYDNIASTRSGRITLGIGAQSPATSLQVYFTDST